MTRYPNNDSSTTRPLGDTSDYDRSSRRPPEPPDPFGSLDLSFIAKGILYICATVVINVFVNSCQVDEEVIVQCKESCGITAGMKEVTATTCSCNPVPDISQNQWVIPKK